MIVSGYMSTIPLSNLWRSPSQHLKYDLGCDMQQMCGGRSLNNVAWPYDKGGRVWLLLLWYVKLAFGVQQSIPSLSGCGSAFYNVPKSIPAF